MLTQDVLLHILLITVDDSVGKEESGLYRGNYRWLGRYYECMGITDNQNITTKSCLVTFGYDQVWISHSSLSLHFFMVDFVPIPGSSRRYGSGSMRSRCVHRGRYRQIEPTVSSEWSVCGGVLSRTVTAYSRGYNANVIWCCKYRFDISNTLQCTSTFRVIISILALAALVGTISDVAVKDPTERGCR